MVQKLLYCAEKKLLYVSSWLCNFIHLGFIIFSKAMYVNILLI